LPALVDSSAVIAAFDRRDPAHAAVTEALRAERSTIVIPAATLPEIAFLLGRRHGASVAADAIHRLATGTWPVEPSDNADLLRAAALMRTYADAHLGFVDATLVAIAERLGATRIHTLDRRDFGLVRPRHIEAFEILPHPG
jgi:predicted nucleic acid-binding protein